MGLVRIMVDAHWNTCRSAQRFPVDRVRNGDRSSRRVAHSICSGSLLALQTVFSGQDAAHRLETPLSSLRLQPYRLIKRVSRLALPSIEAGYTALPNSNLSERVFTQKFACWFVWDPG